jgi:hypothetical protein
MNTGLPVFSNLPAYRVAVAGLPKSAQLASHPAGAIVVVDGSTGWEQAASDAVATGASAVVVAEPHDVSHERLAELVEHGTVPIIVARARLRHDVVSLAVEHRADAPPRIVIAECRSALDTVPRMVRDAVGWIRELTMSSLGVATSAVGAGGGTVLLLADNGRPAGSMIVTITRPEGTLLRVTALGETTTEMELDEPMGSFELVTNTGRGRLVAPARYETGERLAIRRALDAVAARTHPSDLADVIHDDGVAREVLSSATLLL